MGVKSSCIVCSEEIEVTMCCSGSDCGCLGMPIDPPVCSEKCYNELMNNKSKYFRQQIIKHNENQK